MVKEDVLARYLAPLLRGDRAACRSVVEETLQSGIPANSVYLHLIWPVMAEIERLSRLDKISSVQEHLATRINRTIVDQLQNKLPRRLGNRLTRWLGNWLNVKLIVTCRYLERNE